MPRKLSSLSPAALFLLATTLLAACSSGGSGSAPSVDGYAVKEPLAGARFTVHDVDPSAAHLRGQRLESGQTDSKGRIVNLELDPTVSGPVLIEVQTDADSHNRNTGARPLLFELRTVVSAQRARDGLIYVTPLTTVITDVAAANAGSTRAGYGGDGSAPVTDTEVNDALKRATTKMKDQLGLGLLEGVDPLETPPLLVEGMSASADAVARHRTVVEAFTQTVSNIHSAVGTRHPQAALEALAADLGDGRIDGDDADGQTIAGPVGSNPSTVTSALVLTDLDLRRIPGSEHLLPETGVLLRDERSATGNGGASGNTPLTIIPGRASPVADLDDDGIADDNEGTGISTGTLDGKVEDSSGNPISGADVRIYNAGNQAPVARLTTTAQGNYSAGLKAGTSYDIAVSADGFVDASSAGVSISANTTTTKGFTLDDAPRLRGEVINASTNEPIPDVTVVPVNTSDNEVSAVKKTDSKGIFAPFPANPGDYTRVDVRTPGTAFHNNLTLSLNEAKKFNITVDPDQGTLKGSVQRASDASAVADAQVVARNASTGAVAGTAVTDTSGQYSMKLDGASYDVAFQHPDLTDKTKTGISVSPGTSTSAGAALAAQGNLKGTVTDGSTTPVSDATVVVADEADGGVEAVGRTDSQGDFTLVVDAGTHAVEISAAGLAGETSKSGLTVGSNGTTKVTATLQR